MGDAGLLDEPAEGVPRQALESSRRMPQVNAGGLHAAIHGDAKLAEIEAQAAQTVRLGLEGPEGLEDGEGANHTTHPTHPIHPDRGDRPLAPRTAPSRVIEMMLPGV